MKILNIIVFYENREEIEKYIADIFDISNGNVDIAVIVNRDINNNVENLKEYIKRKSIENIFFFEYGMNVGYLNAMLKTIQLIDLSKYKYFILSNTDIKYPRPDFFNLLLERNYNPDVGCIAPSVFSTHTKSYSNPFYINRISKKKLQTLVKTYSHPRIGQFYVFLSHIKSSLKKSFKQNSCYVYIPHGSYMIFTRDFIELIRGYEYGTRLYCEESCIGELLIKNKLKCFYDAGIEVNHEESTITSKINYKEKFSLHKESLNYIIREFY